MKLTMIKTSGVIPAIALLLLATSVAHANEPFAASQKAIDIDAQIDWTQARLIAVQDAGRYKTLDSFARESMTAMYGKEHLPGLSPLASLMEWLFNRNAYADTPVIRLKDKGARIHLSAHMTEVRRQRIQSTGYMTPRELSDATVEARIAELEPNAVMVTAMRRVRNAEAVAKFLDRIIRIVPQPGDEATAMWHTPDELKANLPAELIAGTLQRSRARPIEGISQDDAVRVMKIWAGLAMGWTTGDVEKVQSRLDQLAVALPTLADAGVYPAGAQRAAEAQYYAWGKFTWGYWIYLIGALVGVWAFVTHWRGPWIASVVLLLIAMGVHGYGISLRWQILGRIPVANMFEAVVGSAWIGICLGLLAELRFKTRVFVIGGHVTGFLALILGGYVIPGGGTLTSIMGILDDVMLRIHTVLIIASYALIFLASVIAVIYLFGYYFSQYPERSAEAGLIVTTGGVVLWLLSSFAFESNGAALAEIVKRPFIGQSFGFATAAACVFLLWLVRRGSSGIAITAVSVSALVLATVAIGNQGFIRGMSMAFTFGGAVWVAATGLGLVIQRRGLLASGPALAMSGGGGGGAAALAGGPLRAQRPILAGGMPGDESSTKKLPAWLHQVDWSHLIILNIVFVILFVGVILGAVWADYSWGRPWGWDPKEVFALNTWVIYAILIHTRFVAKDRGLWTAWLSVLGCLMMAFNWAFVNFYIVGLHSYA